MRCPHSGTEDVGDCCADGTLFRRRKIEAAQRELRSLKRRMDAEYPGDGNEEAMTAFIALVEEYDRKARAVRKMRKAAGAVFLSAFQPKAPNFKRALSR